MSGKSPATLGDWLEKAQRLYARHGFDIVRKGPPEHGKDAHVRVYMVKALAGEAA